MKTAPVTNADLNRSVISVPPLARTDDLELNDAANRNLLSHLRDGGVSTAMYGGNANLYNIGMRQYRELLEKLPHWAPADMWVIPSMGPSFGQMLDHIEVLRDHAYPTAMILPLTSPATPAGTATGVRKAVELYGKPIILYIKWESYLTPDLVGELVTDGLVCGIKYAIVRENPSVDAYLRSLLAKVDSSLVISGIGERPAIVHWHEFGLRSYTSGSVCIGPRQSTLLLEHLKAGRLAEAEAVRQRFLPFEDLRDGINPIRVLHHGVAAAGISETGPLLPLLSGLEVRDAVRVGEAARVLAAAELGG